MRGGKRGIKLAGSQCGTGCLQAVQASAHDVQSCGGCEVPGTSAWARCSPRDDAQIAAVLECGQEGQDVRVDAPAMDRYFVAHRGQERRGQVLFLIYLKKRSA